MLPPPPDAEEPLIPAAAAPDIARPESPHPPLPHDAEPHDPYIALRNPNFRRYFIGNTFSLIGSNMTTYAVAYELYRRTNSTLVLGMVGLVQVIPILLLALPAGHFVDRMNRKTMILVSTAIQIAIWIGIGVSSRFANQWFPGLGGMVGLKDAHAPIMLLLLLFNGMCRAVNQPAKQTLLPMLVPAPHFPNAITWNSSLFETSNVLGPMAGGVVLALLLGPERKSESTGMVQNAGLLAPWAFSILYWVNALCQLAQCINIARIKLMLPPPRPRANQATIRQSIIEGIVFVYRRKIILSAMTLDMFAVLLGGATALLPVYAEHILFVGPLGLAALRAAPSVGAVLMALILAHLPPMKRAGRNLLLAVTGFGLAIIVFGLSHSFLLSIVALFFTGVCDNVSVVVRHSLVQLLTPDAMRGRVNAVNTVFISSSNELGEFESGTTAYWAQRIVGRYWGEKLALAAGPMAAVVAGGLGTVLVVIGAALAWPQLRHVGRLVDLRAAHEE